MNCVILQPSYIPWRGYFHQIQKANVFVFYDDIQYDKGGWRNRNRVMAPEGPRWLTIPVHADLCTPINGIRTDLRKPWAQNHRSTLHCYYRKAPYYRRYAPLLDEMYETEQEFLSEFTIESTVLLSRALGLDTRFVRSSEMNIQGTKSGRLVSICQFLGANKYITGPTARDYLEVKLFEKEGIAVEFMTYDYPPYPHSGQAYDPALSILDLLLMTGPDAGKFIWGNSASPSPPQVEVATSEASAMVL